MKTIKIFISLIIISSALLNANSYESYVEILKNDPSIKALHYQEKALRIDAQAMLKEEDPKLILGIDNISYQDPSFREYLPSSKVIGLQQRFSNAKEEASSLYRSYAHKNEIQSQYLFSKLEFRFYEALASLELIQKQLSNLKEQRSILDSIKQEIEDLIYTGKDMASELSRIDERKLQISSQEIRLNAKQNSIRNTLERLFNEVPKTTLPTKKLKAYKIDELFPIVIAMQEQKSAVAKSAWKKAQDSVEFSMQLLYKQREAGKTFDGKDWVSIQGVMSIPFWGKKEKAYLSALENQHSLQEKLQLQTLEWKQKMQNLSVSHKEIQQHIELTTKQILTISKTIKAQENRYKVGHGKYIDVLESKLRSLKSEFALKELETKLSLLAAEQNSHIME